MNLKDNFIYLFFEMLSKRWTFVFLLKLIIFNSDRYEIEASMNCLTYERKRNTFDWHLHSIFTFTFPYDFSKKDESNRRIRRNVLLSQTNNRRLARLISNFTVRFFCKIVPSHNFFYDHAAISLIGWQDLWRISQNNPMQFLLQFSFES